MTQATEAPLYKSDGVNLPLGDQFSAYAGAQARETWNYSPYVEVHDLSDGHFRGPRGVSYVNLPDGCFFAKAADGVGTKVGIHTAAHTHQYAARDLLAMCTGDITRWGGLPLTFSNLLDVSTLGEDANSLAYRAFQLAIDGLVIAARQQQVVLVTGETAELGTYVGNDDPDALTKFNWAGFAEGVYHPDALITGKDIRPGQVVIAFRESGFRSNGISSVRKALVLKFGERWWSSADEDVLERIAHPSISYDCFLAEANGWGSPGFASRIPVTAIVHITGGGIPAKFGELLFQSGHSAELYDLYDPPRIMREVADWRQLAGDRLSDEDFYRTWNGGQGALVVLEEEHVTAFIQLARRHHILAKVCGHITPTVKRSELIIRSRYRIGQALVFY